MAEALVPVFGLILLGAVLGRRDWPAPGFWAAAERLVFWVLFPALLVRATAGAPLDGFGALAVATLGPVVLLTAALLAAVPLLGLSGRRAVALQQGAGRHNNYMAFATATALWGPAALPALAAVTALYVPFINLLSAVLLARTAAVRPSPARLLRLLALNPLVLACALGLLLQAMGLGLPPLLDGTLAILERAALPLALLAVGAALRRPDAGRDAPGLAAAALLKLLVAPALALGLARLTGLEGLMLGAVVVYAAMPAAPTGYVQTRAMGGEADFVAAAITLETALAVLTLPLVVGLL